MNHYILILCTILLSAISSFAADRVYNVGYIEGSGGHAIAIKRLAKVYASANLKVEFVPLPAKRSITMAANGQLDGEAARVPSIEKSFPSLIRVNEPINEIIGFAYITDQSLLDGFDGSLNSIKDRAILRVLGVKWAENKLKGFKNTQTVYSYDLAVKMLARGKVDVLLGTQQSVEASIKRLEVADGKAAKISVLPKVVHQTFTYHYLNYGNASIQAKLEEAIRRTKIDW